MEQILRIAFCFGLLVSATVAKWNYEMGGSLGPSKWGTLADGAYEKCGSGKQQSPINIVKSNATLKTMPALTFTRSAADVEYTISNSGHSISATPVDEAKAPNLTGGPLGANVYKVAGYHLHFGNTSVLASEHAFDGERTTGEMHVVTYSTNYTNLDAALGSGKYNALAVVGTLFKVRTIKTGHKGITRTLFYAQNLHHPKNHTRAMINFDDVVYPSSLKNLFAYNGSLTTPACNEVVQWIVLDRMVAISPVAIQSVSDLMTEEDSPVFGNARPLQQVNDRVVLRNFELESGSERLSSSLTQLTILVSALLVWASTY